MPTRNHLLTRAWLDLTTLWVAAGASNNDRISVSAGDPDKTAGVEIALSAAAPAASLRGHVVCGTGAYRAQVKTAADGRKVWGRAYRQPTGYLVASGAEIDAE